MPKRKINETTEEREARLQTERLRKAASRAAETPEQRELRLSAERLRQTVRRTEETSEQREMRLAAERLRISKIRENESAEQKEDRLAELRKRRAEECENQKETRLTALRKRRADESEDQKEARLAALRQQRSDESEDQKEARLAARRQQRAEESEDQKEARLAARRQQRSEESEDEKESRLAVLRQQATIRRAAETEVQTLERQTRNNMRMSYSRAKPWLCLKEAAFTYDPAFDYANIPAISIGRMSVSCQFCSALRFECETVGLCCSSGKVSLLELPPLPEPLNSLMNGSNSKSREFLQNIRKYNSCFQMTSFGSSVPIPQTSGFMPTFKIQGQIYHRIGSLLPVPNQESTFLNIYFLGDEEAEIQRRCAVISDTNKNLIASLQKMLHENNLYVQQFKTALENNQNEDLKIIIKADKKPLQGHSRIYNAPVVSEVAIIIAGNEFEKRDIVLTKRSNELQNITETHISYDALQYPLMFPRGEDGYATNIKQVVPGTSVCSNKTVSAMSYYSYRLMVRPTENHLLNYRQLLHQYVVDMYAKIEAERLLFIRMNQKKLRVDEYIHLKDATVNDGNAENQGKLIILPSTYTGGPRNMHEYAQDAITYVRHGGKPSLFITFTFNPKCKEMDENLVNGQTRTHRHDLIARIFHQKLIKFMHVITKGEIFGPVKYWLYSVEWQKRGLPHAHVLIWLSNGLNVNQIDDIISAEIPDPALDKNLHDIVIKNMVHGPCGNFNRHSPCMQNNTCSKKYPRNFIEKTQTMTNGYPLYRRRKVEDGGQTSVIKIKSEDIEIDNRWIVPYNPLLLKMFDAHINVECCNSVQSIKYILKYVHKGSDQGVFTTARENGNIDEISEYQAGRYISSNEAVWRIFGFPIHERYPSVMKLDVHLENGQRIYFNQNNLAHIVANPPNTTLTGFFELCKSDDFAKTLLYAEVSRYYTWDKSRKVFNRRKQGTMVEGHIGIRSSDVLSRVYTINLKNFDCYYLRMLLHKVRGPTCFKDLRTIDGVEYDTYHAACLALGLLENDNQWEETLKEANESDSPNKIRLLFAIILSFCEPSNPQQLWENHKNCMSEDILNRLRRDNPQMTLEFTDLIYNEALILIENKVLEMIGKPLSEVGMKSPSREKPATKISRELLRETSYNAEMILQFVMENEPLLNQEQRDIYDEVLRRHSNNEGGIIFIDAPGGTGKTFVINLLLARIRSENKVALAVASSGIAATLMSGGRTAHSTLQIPLDLIHNETPVCNIKKGSDKAKLLLEAKALFWDEVSMMHKRGFEAVNRTLQDIRGNQDIMGGLNVILAGDFRQILPVIPRGTMVDEIQACLKSSQIWSYIKPMQLRTNMRVLQSNSHESEQFSQYLFNVGNGEEAVMSTGKIKLNGKFGEICVNLDDLINKVYPDIEKKLLNKKWLKERAILAPLNVKVDAINHQIQQMIRSDTKTYFSIDKCVNEDEATSYPVEFLQSLNPNGLPPHRLELKVGSPIMLLRNLDPPKLCNGSRLTVKSLSTNVIEATLLGGQNEGETVFIPRIPLIPTDLPFAFKRLQFPVRLAYAFTINKAQGQSLSVTGLDLTDECFSHGQLYVGMSRAKDPGQLYFVADQNCETKNVVYRQVL